MLNRPTDQQKEHVLRVYETRSKKTTTAYICWFLFGIHYFYLGKPWVNILYWITGGGFTIWLIIDMFRMSGIVDKANHRILGSTIEEAVRLFPNAPIQTHLLDEEREYIT